MNAKMQKALSAVAALPEETQEALASSLLEEAQYLTRTSLTAEQHAEVVKRQEQPRIVATPDQVAAVFGKYQ